MATKIPAGPDDHNDHDQEPIDPYDPEGLHYDESEFASGDVRTKKVVTAIKVRKPGRQEWFRLHPGPQYQLPTRLFLRENEELLRPETYLVLPEYVHLFKNGIGLTPVCLRLAINSLGTEFLWDIKRPRDGVMTDYYIGLQEAADEAETSWVRLE